MILLGEKLSICFLLNESKVLAYSINYTKEKAINHLEKIKKFHKLDGEIVFDENLEIKYENYIKKKIYKDETPCLDLSIYKYKEVYEFLLNIPKGKVTSYSEISKVLKLKMWEVILALKHNPFLIIIPCHRIIKKNGEISGYTPLGKYFKIKLLKAENYI